MANATKLKIHTKHGKSFVRNGVTFTPETQDYDASALTEEQYKNLMDTEVLDIRDAGNHDVRAQWLKEQEKSQPEAKAPIVTPPPAMESNPTGDESDETRRRRVR